jgi:hypothetical protein
VKEKYDAPAWFLSCDKFLTYHYNKLVNVMFTILKMQWAAMTGNKTSPTLDGKLQRLFNFDE